MKDLISDLKDLIKKHDKKGTTYSDFIDLTEEWFDSFDHGKDRSIVLMPLHWAPMFRKSFGLDITEDYKKLGSQWHIIVTPHGVIDKLVFVQNLPEPIFAIIKEND